MEPEPEPEPPYSPTTAVFEEAGPLGLILASTDGERGRVRLAGIAPGTQAERCRGLAGVETGLLLESLRVGQAPALDVTEVGYLECVELIKTQVRPLAFVWVPEAQPILAPPVGAYSPAAPADAEPPGSTSGSTSVAESGMATLRRRVTRALSRSSIDDGVPEVAPPAAVDHVDADDFSGLSWTSSNPDSLGQLPRVQLACSVDQESGQDVVVPGAAGSPTISTGDEADLEMQWKQRERAAHREGYLSQREDGFLSRWQRRWFVVDYGVLKVYKDYDAYRKDERQAGEDATRSPSLRRRSSSSRQIVVSGEDVVGDHTDADSTSLDTRDQEEFDFLIRLPMDKTLTLRASNQDDKKAWMHAMQLGKSIKAERDSLAPLVKLVGQHGDIPHALEHPTVRIDDIYSMDELLGRGEIGKVYRAKHRLTGEPVAVKVVDKTKFSARLSALRRVATREIIVLTKYNMHHPHVVQTRAVIETADWVFIVMELLEGGELQKNIEERRSYAETDAAEVMLRLGLTLGFLHSQGIAHRDVKPENVLCGADHVDIKLADFGFAHVLGDTRTGFKSTVGTPAFMAPEIGDALAKEGYSYGVDVWSAGVLLYFMLTGTLPFDQLGHGDMMERRKGLETSALVEDTWDHISHDAKDLVRQMLRYNPHERIDPVRIVHHPWITSNCEERPDLVELMTKCRPPAAKGQVQEDFDLHNGVLHGLGIVTVDAAKLSADGALWIGEIPDHLVAEGGREASDNLRSLFEPFGEIVSVTVRTKPGTRKSWAMLSFTTEESAIHALEADVTVEAPDPATPAMKLKVKRAAVKAELQKASTGALGSILKQHASSVLVTESTIWVGGIPSFAVEKRDVAAEEQLSSVFRRFGTIVSITVRKKPGTDKSWALITFGELAAVAEAVQATVVMTDEDATEVALDVRRAELGMETDGALADISAQHEQEVQNHVVLDVLDISAATADAVQGAEETMTSQSPRGAGGSGARRVQNRRAKLTDVWQPSRKKS